jgi:pyridoxamine 5'-phosphate oxidase family protein
MSVFTQAEIEYLTSVTLGRLATIGRDGRPHIAPVTYVYNPEEDTIDVGGIDFGNTKKWRDVQHNTNVTFLIDDFTGTSARAVEVRGDAEAHEAGGSQINPRFPHFVEQFVRIRPRYVVGWGLDPDTGMTPSGFKANGRRV